MFVVAPGEKVDVAAPSDKKDFIKASGTSYATAYVTAIAAFLLSEYPDMTPDEFRQILKESCRDLGEQCYDTAYGWGLINVQAALKKMRLSEFQHLPARMDDDIEYYYSYSQVKTH